MKIKRIFPFKMSTAIYQKDAASRLRAQMRRKAISLYYNSRGPKMTVEDVAKKMQLPLRYVKKWISRYEKLGLHGYVGQRQSAILCIYKKNPNLTLTQLRVLLRKVGIVLSNNELGNILKSLKHVLTDPGFMSASEDQVINKLKKVTKVQPKSIIRMNQKISQEQARESKEHSYALPVKSIFEDHNYVANPDLFYEDNDYSIYENVNKLVKYKTDLMNKIATVSKSLDKLFTDSAITTNNQESAENSLREFKISLVREQILYLCLEMKGPKANNFEIVKSLPLSEMLITKWIEQAKNIKRFVHKKHINKCCGKIQETIVRLKKLNPYLTIEQIKDILHNVRIELSRLKLERQINSVKYMIIGPEEFREKEFEDKQISDNDLDHCIEILTSNIESANKTIRKAQKSMDKIENISTEELSLQKIVELNSSDRRFITSSKPNAISTESKIDLVRSKFQAELANILNKNEKEKKMIKKLSFKDVENTANKINHSVFSNKTYSNQISTNCAILKKQGKEIELVSAMKKMNGCIKASSVDANHTNSNQSTVNGNNLSFLQYFSLVPTNGFNKKESLMNSEQEKQLEHTEVDQNVYCNNSENHEIECKDLKESKVVKTITSNIISHKKENKYSNIITLLNNNQIKGNSLNNENKNLTTQDQCKSLKQCYENTPLKQKNIEEPTNQNKIKEISNNTVQDYKCIDNTMEVVKENLVKLNTFTCAKEKQNVNKNKIITQQSSSNKPSYKKQKRKYSENIDIESEFEPIEDLSFIKHNSDSDIIMKEETDDEKKIMTEYIECEDNSVVIKYFLAK